MRTPVLIRFELCEHLSGTAYDLLKSSKLTKVSAMILLYTIAHDVFSWQSTTGIEHPDPTLQNL
eukprot:3277173-Amphidinium_carterae.1